MECTSVAKNPLQEHGRMEKISTKVLTFVNLCLWPGHHGVSAQEELRPVFWQDVP